MCSYCNKSEYKKAQCLKKSLNTENNKTMGPNTNSVQVDMMRESSINESQTKKENFDQQQWLVLAFANTEVQVFAKTAKNLNLI